MNLKVENIRKILSKNLLTDGFEPIIDLSKSSGSWIVDQRNGDKFLDMFSMYASGSIGYNHPAILENKDILTKASLFKPTLSDIYRDLYAEFMEVFEKNAIPSIIKPKVKAEPTPVNAITNFLS